MKIIDISWPISSATTGYKDKQIVAFENVKNFDRDGARETTITLSSHTGTHVDAPSHFLKDGIAIDQIKLSRLIGPCKVLDMTSVPDKITSEDLQDYTIEKDDIILLKTSNSLKSPTEKFSPQFIYLEHTGAAFLAEKQIKAVGIDYLGIERNQPDHLTHSTLMQNNVIIIEGLRLQASEAGVYFFICLPLYTIGVEAAPARAIIIEEFSL